MRARDVIAVAFILVLVGVKLTFLAVPIAAADARSSGSGSVDGFSDSQEHHEASGAGNPRHVVCVSVALDVNDPDH